MMRLLLRGNIAAGLLLLVGAAGACAEPPGAGAPPERTLDTATTLWYGGERRRAVEILEEIVTQEPDHHEARLSLIVLLREAGRLDEALWYSAPGLEETDGPDPALGARRPSRELAAHHAMNSALAGAPSCALPGAAGSAGSAESGARSVLVARHAFWTGVSRLQTGLVDRAGALFKLAIADSEDEHFPYAHFLLGTTEMFAGADRDQLERARERLERARAQEPNLSATFLPLARIAWSLGEHERAWDQLQRARIALPWNQSIPRLLDDWEAARPELTADAEARAARRRLVSEPPRVEPIPVAAGERVVRVGLAEKLRRVHLKSAGAAEIVVAGESTREIAPGAVLRAVLDEDQIAVGIDGGSEIYRGAGPVRIIPRDAGATTTVFDIEFGRGQFSAGREDRSYRGAIELLPTSARGSESAEAGASPVGLTVVNELSLSGYLYSVVPSEIPASWPTAALEAQAVAARSYTLHPRGRYAERGFELLSSVSSAYYRGVTNEHPRTTAAVDATVGRVLLDGARPLDAVYSANAAGYTESSESVWGWPTPLVATSDPLLPELTTPRSPAELYRWIVTRPESYSGRPPYSFRAAYRWTLAVPREAIERRLAAAGESVGTVTAVLPGERGITGRVEWVRVEGTEGETVVRRDRIRSRLGGLRSNLFVVAPYRGPARTERGRTRTGDAPTYFVFEGAGWGHGVGMCQTGAAGMAADGYSAQQILAHYYPQSPLGRWE
jgi:SpoIID/LytB domain protein